MNQNGSIATSEEARGKESRERDSHNKPVNQRHEKKDIIGKKPERFNNLEKNGKKRRPQQAVQQAPKKEEETIKTITLPEKMTIKELAERMKIQASVIIKKLFLQGTMVTVNSEVTYEAAEEIALEYNCICEQEVKIDVIAELLKEETEDEAAMVKRPPVVCVMGHVDHGKTSLLDAIRDTHVIDREAGGITQHIGAYMVTCNGEKITFLDTPGHEAFTAMRMRGANSTDIAILVVAADDGVMPQTVEAISHAKAAGVEIIVAVNKIDKPSANIERVKQELAEYELIPEDWGGSTIFVPVSAHTNEGIEQLLEMVLLTAEVSELKADPKRNARGLVIEAQLDKGRGSVATVLVQKGTLKVGQPIACGSCYGKVRAMIDDKGKRVKEAGPSTPVEILGLNNVPNAGEIFVCTENEKEAKSFADTFISQGREKMLDETKTRMSLDDLFSQIKSGNVKELPIIVKADVQGSVEAVKQSLVKLSNEEVVVKIIHGGVGAINESDVSLASASNAIIIGFNVRPDATAKATSEREGVDMRLYKVIYNAIEDVQAAMNGMLDPIFEEKILGHAEVRQIFKASVIGNIAGSYVMDGIFQRGCKVRINREGKQIFEGELSSLKRFKDDVKEVRTGYECGLVFDGFNEIQELDMVEAYTMVEVPR
ncbi:MAG: translation initiation factor IF-2 [Lachnospiraceae bacterium]